jgi:Raf kinase inhibitor-like YbhB/YbcL family protein
MKLTSKAFSNNEAIPARYSCQGDKINPQLGIGGVPQGAGALALVVDDPDAPGGTFDHWVMWNLPPELREIPENWAPEPGVNLGANGAGSNEWYPPCPPSGMHHYHFKLYALDRKLNLAEGSSKAELEGAMQGHVVAQTELVGTYTKQ